MKTNDYLICMLIIFLGVLFANVLSHEWIVMKEERQHQRQLMAAAAQPQG